MAVKLMLVGLVAALGLASLPQAAMADSAIVAESAESFAAVDALEAAMTEEAVLGGSCKTVHESVAGCSVSFKVCGKISKLKWKYDCTACASGKCASGSGKSAKGAAEEAAKRLFAAPFPACAVPPQLQAGAELAPVSLTSFEESDAALESTADVSLGASCKTVVEQVASCSVSIKVCGGFYRWRFRYTATACASGKCATSGRTKSPTSAAKEAATKLFALAPACAAPAMLSASGEEAASEEEAVSALGASCKTVAEQIAGCTVSIKVCGGFYRWQFRYTATACASGICATSGHTKSATSAAKEAATKLFGLAPACAVPAKLQADAEPSALMSADAIDVEAAVEESEEEAAGIEPEIKLGGSCKTVVEQVASCSVSIKVCGGFHSWRFRYTATACASGKCATSGRTKSPTSAAKEAATKLFALAPACAVPQ